MINTYKILNGFDRVDPSTWFKQINQTRRTRLNADSANLEPTFSRTEIRKSFFTIRVPDLCNKLPAHVKSSTSIYMFKSRYDDYLCTRTVDAFLILPGRSPDVQLVHCLADILIMVPPGLLRITTEVRNM